MNLDPFSYATKSKTVTMDEVEQRRKLLKDMGLEDSWIGKANKVQGQMVGTRDGIKSSILSSLVGSGGSLAGATGAAGAAGAAGASGAAGAGAGAAAGLASL